MIKKLALTLLTIGMIGSASAALIDTRIDSDANGATVDGVLGADEYGTGNSYSYTGGGTGFGGALGAGTLYFQSDATNLYLGFQPGANLNDYVALYFDTRTGGFVDADMNDTGDPGRNVISNLGSFGDETFPILPDFGIVIGDFGIVTFELTAGNTANHLNFVDFSGTFTGANTNFREYTIPLSSLGLAAGSNLDFFAAYSSSTNFLSNESIPVSPGLNGGANPGNSATGTFENFDRFVVVPEPSSAALLAGPAILGAWFFIRRRRA
jgi:hypothetical protein